jgi:hypothetical protein
VLVGAGGGEAEGAGAQRFLGQPAHLGNILTGCPLQVDRALAHDIDP